MLNATLSDSVRSRTPITIESQTPIVMRGITTEEDSLGSDSIERESTLNNSTLLERVKHHTPEPRPEIVVEDNLKFRAPSGATLKPQQANLLHKAVFWLPKALADKLNTVRASSINPLAETDNAGESIQKISLYPQPTGRSEESDKCDALQEEAWKHFAGSHGLCSSDKEGSKLLEQWLNLTAKVANDEDHSWFELDKGKGDRRTPLHLDQDVSDYFSA